MVYFLSFVTVLVLISILDVFWLGLTINRIYKPGLGDLLADKPNYKAAFLFYIIYALGITHFVVHPAFVNGSDFIWGTLQGALFGLISYCVYNLPNLALIKKWSEKVSIVDIVWGTALTSLTTFLTLFFLPKIISWV